MKHRELVRRVLVANEAEVEELTGVGREYLHDHVCECLPETDSSPSMERDPAVRVSFRAFRRQAHFIVRVESLRQELVWHFPLVLIEVKVFKVECETITCF